MKKVSDICDCECMVRQSVIEKIAPFVSVIELKERVDLIKIIVIFCNNRMF